MSTPKKKPRSIRVAALAVFSLLVAMFAMSACTPEETAAMNAVADHQNGVLAVVRSQSNLSDAQLARLANCESGGNPTARSRNGKYLGLYQFNQGTWNSTAQSVLPLYVGVSPAIAPPDVQHAMARALYAARGRSPWPVCGRRI